MDSKEEPDRDNYTRYVDGPWAGWWKYVAATAAVAVPVTFWLAEDVETFL